MFIFVKNILGDTDFTTTTWITDFDKNQKIKRTVDGVTFTFTHDGTTVTINDFPVTEKDWENVIRGNSVTLKKPDGKTATITFEKPNKVLFNNNPFYGNKITTEIQTTTTRRGIVME